MADNYQSDGDFIDNNVVVHKRDGEDPRAFLKRFHKAVRRSGVLEEYKKRQYFTKESKKKRIAKNKAQRKKERDK